VKDSIHFREKADARYTDASYEINLACNYNCEHCYLDERKNRKLDVEGRKKLFDTMSKAGVIRLHTSGGEPLIDKHFPETYRLAQQKGFLVRISSNGYALGNEEILQLFKELPPVRLAVSLYGASAQSYEGLTRTPPGTFEKFKKSLAVASDAGIRVRLKLIITKHNETEIEAMKALAEGYGFEHHIYSRMAATLEGRGAVLNNQAASVNLRANRTPFKGCGAGKSFFHADPMGKGSICMTGRDQTVDIINEGVAGLDKLPVIADQMLTRGDGCTGCNLALSCATCPVIVNKYRMAKADKAFFCQH